ncbi:TraB/GumN family protein [Sphingomonas nostoxanthinifaciens]|uniref:TraB/GumN family protein n=1 Tax=Sphingomonas nostoxanthinifaciens TaxID=2872652 RepID=UPI001CC21C94|nr:TraB/GumN family protein [Sphingomonas nostoxanthinifaciens]UAK24971.1 TraB/GumN family protein [Sphingomonas nostoxanthinifaciens]
MRIARLLAPLLLLTAAAPAPPQPHPALWKVVDADTTIYLFGTIHVLPTGYKWRDATLDGAIGAAQSLTLETVLDTDPSRVATLLMGMGQGKGLPPLAERVPPAKRAALAALAKASGFPQDALDRMKTWAAAIVLTGAAMRQIDLTGGPGVEPQLTTMFRSSNRPVEGLETPEQQLGFFDRLPEAAQRGFLEATLDSPGRARAEFEAMLDAWARGDPAAIEKSFSEDPEFTPALRDLLIRQRDQAWAVALAERMKRPGTVFVAVGAGHLVGPDSVQRMLAAKGFKAERIQ